MNDNVNTGEVLLAIGTTLQDGRYRVERYLASGGFGNTYLVTDLIADTLMVIKEFFLSGVSSRDVTDGCTVRISLESNRNVFNSQLRKFEREAQRVRYLNHPNIVRVHNFFHENGTAYYVMDYVDGETLAERVARMGAISEDEVKQFLPQLLGALELVHARGLFHLDLKPGNVMIDRTGMLRLIDFGASKQMAADGSATTTTGLAYTPGYAAPEQTNGQIDRIGVCTDLYALGATLYNLLTARTPPSWVDLNEMGVQALQYPGIPVSERMRFAISQMMMPSRLRRPQSVNQVRQMIYSPVPISSRVVSRQPVSRQPISRPPVSRQVVRPKSNRGLKIAAVIVVALMVFAVTVAGVYFGLTSGDEPAAMSSSATHATQQLRGMEYSSGKIPYGQYGMSGTIGPATVSGTLNYNSNGTFTGECGYRGRTSGLRVSGTHSADGTWTATEYNDAEGLVSGTYNGRASGTTITGSFTNYKGNTYNFRISLTAK